MWILPLVGYAGVLLGFGFLTLAIASGLYYLSELVEEHTVSAKKILTRLIHSVVLVQALLLLVDGFPIILSLLNIGSHAIYLGNLRRFPIVTLSNPIFIVSCGLVILNHFLWFRHFSDPPPISNYSSTYRARSRYDYVDVPSFTEIASYFGLCVWLVPFALFVSLSAGENVLPSMGNEYATGSLGNQADRSDVLGGSTGSRRKRGAKGLVRAVIDGALEWVGETSQALGIQREHQRRF